MRKILISLLLLLKIVAAYSYNDVLLEAQVTMFPKILLLDTKLSEKLVEGKIILGIVYQPNDKATAERIASLIEQRYHGSFDQYRYKIALVPFSEVAQEGEVSAYYVLNSPSDIEDVAAISKKKGIITFAYDSENLKRGLLLSLMLEKNTVLYLNQKNLNRKKIDFVVLLLQIVKFID